MRALRAAKPGVPVIVITGLAEAESDYRGAGVTFRQKPCPPEELIALVRSSIAGAPVRTSHSRSQLRFLIPRGCPCWRGSEHTGLIAVTGMNVVEVGVDLAESRQ